jgi:hypothetical protein
MRYHSQIAIAAYHDLRRLLQDDQVADIKGTPVKTTVKGRVFWYDKFRVGTGMAQRYIGPDSDALQERLQQAAELKAEAKDRQKDKTRLVRILRAESFASTDQKTGSLLNAFTRVGVFRLGGTLIGTVAFRHYEGELGLKLGFDDLARTGDIDVGSFERLSFAVGDRVEESMADVFSDLKFQPVPSTDPGRVWRWSQSGGDMLVEFLMPAMQEEGIRDLPALGVSAMALRHLDYVLTDPIPAVSLYRSGVLVQVPRPERFAIHKLIIAERRAGGPDAAKAIKDRAQAAVLIEALAELRPDELREALEDAQGRGPGWQRRIGASLGKMPGTSARIEAL